MKCPNCNENLDSNAKFCSNCGTKIELVCSQCNSIIKQGDKFCSHCGTRYSNEEKKDDTIYVAGNKDNCLEIAQNAYDAGNKEEAEKYCNKVIEIDVDNYQAWLLKGKAAGWQTSISNNRFDEVINAFCKAIEKAPVEKKDYIMKSIINELNALFKALISLTCDNFYENPTENNEDNIINSIDKIEYCMSIFSEKIGLDVSLDKDMFTVDLYNAVSGAWTNIYKEYKLSNEGHPDKYDFDKFRSVSFSCLNLFRKILEICNKDRKLRIIGVYEKMIEINGCLKVSKSWDYDYIDSAKVWAVDFAMTDAGKKACLDDIKEYAKRIYDIDPSYVSSIYKFNEKTGDVALIGSQFKETSNIGCYIATAVYKSYDCPEVWTLRRFRDFVLLENFVGKLFVKVYYFVSPTIVKYWGKTKIFNLIFKTILDKFVIFLNNKGFENTRYEDKR